VRDAEEIVRRAWGQELFRQRDHMEFALHAAGEDRDTAYRCLAAAQRDGDPRKISAAHIALEQALEAIRKSSVACDRLRPALRAELGLLARAAKEHAVVSLVCQVEQGGSALTGQPLEPRGGPARSGRPVRAPQRPWGRFPRWLRRVVMGYPAGLGQP
jgi:hypothetical protein